MTGVGHLAEDGYKLATDGQYREQAWNSAVNDAKAAANFAATAVTDPGKAADEIGNTASHAWHALETAYNQAAARGQGSEFIGQIFGQGAILVGTAFIPGGAEADAVEALGNAGRATTLLGDAGKLTDVTETAGRVGALTGDAGKAVDAGKAIDAGKAVDATANATHVVQQDDAAAFKAAAEHATPNTRYDFGNYSWTTDAKGRTVEAEGQVELTPAGRDTALQDQIGKEGEPTDVGFHLIGDRFNGPTNRLNVVPGNGKPLTDGLPKLNQGAYKRFENQVAKLAADPHNTVEVRVRPEYNGPAEGDRGSARPRHTWRVGTDCRQYEMQEEDGGLTEDRRGFYIRKDPAGNLRKAELAFNPEVKAMFRQMNDEIRRTEGKRWGTCDLEVDPPGKFRFSFSYDPPKRINGVFDDDSMGRFDRYLETYKA